ncbi:MAG: hypothetical protein DMF92_23405 [Acidobacteria bacterium]|nr:MAG: hypothetical protein DMF92_23405 [Acidobacteriota bacterium]
MVRFQAFPRTIAPKLMPGHLSSTTPGPRALSVIIPAYCECDNILQTLDNVTGALQPLTLTYEVLVIDDGSTDGTAALVVINERNMGFGWSYRRGVEAASLEHIVMVHGDNAWGRETLGEFFSHVGEADVIIGYTRRMARSRSWRRTAISKAFTLLVNLITDRRLQYYNGLQIHRAAVLKSLRIESSGYGFQAEVLVKSLRLAKTFLEVPMDLIERKKGQSKAFRLKNLIDVARTVRLLYGLERTSTPERPSAPVPGR